MKYLLDTDHLSILQRQAGRDYSSLATLMAHYPLSDFAVSTVTFYQERQKAEGRREYCLLPLPVTVRAASPRVGNKGIKPHRLYGAYNWLGSESPTKKFLLPSAFFKEIPSLNLRRFQSPPF
jgi:hypothetical protein